MANIFENIVRPVGESIRGVARGLFPGAASAADMERKRQNLLMDIQKIRAAGGIGTEAGRAMLAEMSGKYNPSMFVSPYEVARTEYLRAGGSRYRGLSNIQNELDFWRRQLQGSVDPVWGARTVKDPKTGKEKITGVLNQELYDAAQRNISRLTKQIQQIGTTGGEIGALGNIVSPEELAQQQSKYLENIIIGPEQTTTQIRRGLPYGSVGGWQDLSESPKLQEIQTRKRIQRKTPAALPVPSSPSQLIGRIANMNMGGRVVGIKRASEIVKNYPELSKRMLNLNPAELREVIGAIEDGMSELEILGFFSIKK